MANTAIPKDERRPNQAPPSASQKQDQNQNQNQSQGQGKVQAQSGATARRPEDGNQVTQKHQTGPTTVNYSSPPVHIYEVKDGYMLEAEMPGVNRSGLEVLLEGNELTIVGHRDGTVPAGSVLYRESRQASFRRVFELDPAIDTQRITARVENGVLYLALPKAESVKPRKISVG